MKKSILAIALGFSATASMAGNPPVASMTAPQTNVTRQISIQEKRQKGSSPFREGKSG